MELKLQDAVSTSTGTIAATAGLRAIGGPFQSQTRSIVVSQTAVGAATGTVNVYQILQASIKRLVASFTLNQATPVQGLDLVNAGQTFLAEIAFTANPSNDTVTVVVEG